MSNIGIVRGVGEKNVAVFISSCSMNEPHLYTVLQPPGSNLYHLIQRNVPSSRQDRAGCTISLLRCVFQLEFGEVEREDFCWSIAVFTGGGLSCDYDILQYYPEILQWPRTSF